MIDIPIRLAEYDDVPALHELMLELAKFEKMPHEVWSTLEDYQRDFKKGLFKAFVASQEETILGMAFFYQTYSTWKGKMYHLEDLVVKAHARNKGIGQLLFDAYVNYAKSNDANLVKWEVLDWNEGAVRFYERNNAIIEKCWWDGKIFFPRK